MRSARIDGATDYQIIRKVVFPLVKPALATVMLLAFQGAWLDANASTMYLDSETLKTFAYYIGTLTAGGSVITQGDSSSRSINYVSSEYCFIYYSSVKSNESMANSGN